MMDKLQLCVLYFENFEGLNNKLDVKVLSATEGAGDVLDYYQPLTASGLRLPVQRKVHSMRTPKNNLFPITFLLLLLEEVPSDSDSRRRRHSDHNHFS